MKPISRNILKALLLSLVFIACLYFILIFSFGGYGKKPLILNHTNAKNGSLFFAHRALSGYYPESSLLAVKKSKEEGLAGVELDIEKDKNGELIIFHDQNTQRLLGFDGLIDTMTLAQIKKYPLIFQEKVKSSSHVIGLKDLMESKYKDSLIFYFDMKLNDFKTADEMVTIIKKYHIEKSCIIANSDIFFIFYIEHNYPEMITVLEGFDAGKEWTYYLMPKFLKPDFFSGFSWNLDQAHVDWLKKKNLLNECIVYGVDAGNLKTMLNYGLKNFILDYDTTMKHTIELH